MMPLILGLGGSLNDTSLTGRVLEAALAEVRARGARTRTVSGTGLSLPLYQPGTELRPMAAQCLIDGLREADGVIIASPAYHGSMSGAVKNALDYAEELRTDLRPYLSGRTVACISTAGGDQGAAATLSALRNVVHALRGWPTPFGLAVTPSTGNLDEHGRPCERLAQHLNVIADEVLQFTHQAAGSALTAGQRG